MILYDFLRILYRFYTILYDFDSGSEICEIGKSEE